MNLEQQPAKNDAERHKREVERVKRIIERARDSFKQANDTIVYYEKLERILTEHGEELMKTYRKQSDGDEKSTVYEKPGRFRSDVPHISPPAK